MQICQRVYLRRHNKAGDERHPHTRNDQLASQNTIHPNDDRVFSIRELMKMMTVPESFKWIDKSLEELNALSEEEVFAA